MMKAHLTLAFALLLACTGAALAKTPDGLPPALETICDMETGAAYGLCNAYCEAMDCELANDNNPATEPHASANACSKVRGKFQNVTGHDVPCEVSCPCTEIPEFNAQLAGVNSCYQEEPEPDFDVVIASTGTPQFIPPFIFTEGAAAVSDGENSVCGYFNLETEIFNILPITAEQAEVCLQIVRDAAASRNVTCETF